MLPPPLQDFLKGQQPTVSYKKKMNTQLNFKTIPRIPWKINKLVACMFISAVMLIGIQAPISAQEVQYERPTWRFGIAGAANANFYEGTTQELNDDLTSLQPFGHGNGFGLFLAPTIEYHRPETMFGFMLQAGYDSRRGTFDQVMSPCDCPLDLSTELSYITIEPSIRMAPFKSNFYLYAGPRLAFGLNESFEYEQNPNPDFPNSLDEKMVNADFSNMEKTQLSMQIGTGWDIPINSTSNQTQYMISPFITYHPYFGQTPRSIETWNITTIRAGVAIKLGRGKRIESKTPAAAPVSAPVAVAPAVSFTVNSPVNETVAVSFIESFPLRNYVFFDQGSTTIPDKYIKLNKEQAMNFSEVQLGRFNQITAVGRSDRQMTVYYNILNIMGERMQNNRTATINLVGSSEQGERQARLMADAVKSYLVNTFGITSSRITTQGKGLPASLAGGTEREQLLRQEHSRVAIESSSLALLKEYQTGPDAPLGSISLTKEAPLDSYVSINANGAAKAFKSWKLEVRDENDRLQNFGPYYRDSVSLSGKSILGDRSKGTYKFTLIGETQDGRTISKVARADVVQWVTPVVKHGQRFSVIFEFDQSKTNAAYEKYLLDVVTPAISDGATVRIQGYSDSIGDKDYNQKLSEARAENVRSIIQNGLTKAGRKDVKFDVKGHGALISESNFKNTLPEQRFYNRTVLIDIIPAR
jgi:outer membrane protein OmpA-like peptidoglycan-associated protein